MATPALRIWELCSDPNSHLCVQQPDLRFFNGKFDGGALSDSWATPEYEILGKSKKVADLTSWQVGSRAFLVTEKARAAIAELCGTDVEFLPFDRIKGKDLYALNVLRLEDLRDHAAIAFVDQEFGFGPV